MPALSSADMRFSPQEEAILARVQGDLPRSLTPFAAIAAECGAKEEDVLALLTRLKEDGAIRRFGASLRHQRAGWQANAMCAWRASPEEAEVCGPLAAAHANVSHVYYRPSAVADWPYAFYTMVHGRSRQECLDVIETLAKTLPLSDYLILPTLRELKKVSPRYFASSEVLPDE